MFKDVQDFSYWGGTALWKRKPANGRQQQQQQPRLNSALLVSACVLFTYCFQVGQVIYVYIHFGEFYDCVYGCAESCMVAAVLSVEPSLKISTFCVYKSCRFLLKIRPIVVECGKKNSLHLIKLIIWRGLDCSRGHFFKLGLLHVE